MEIIFLTGRSGAGKSQAADCLEDWGYNCVDNIPAELIAALVDTMRRSSSFCGKLAIVSDVRYEGDLASLIDLIERFRSLGDICRVIYLDCRDDVIINRYKFTRRLHPLMIRRRIGIADALALENEMLLPLKKHADVRIDTSELSTHQLQRMLETFLATDPVGGMFLCCMSFGFKYGIPAEADTVLDVRCFPNPYYIESMRPKTGLDPEVNRYVFSFEETRRYVDMLKEYFLFMLPLYKKEGKKQFTVAVGCTGGQHRSVAIADRLGVLLCENGYDAVVIHRNAKQDGAGI